MTPEEFMAAEMRTPIVWGFSDCIHTADRWCQLRGPSFVAGSGVDFQSEAEAEAMLGERAMPLWVARAMRAAGYHMTQTPQPGDIGTIVVGDEIACAIRGATHWLYRSERGLSAAGPYARVLGAWDTR